jgi:hypothetical protein
MYRIIYLCNWKFNEIILDLFKDYRDIIRREVDINENDKNNTGCWPCFVS